MGPDAFVPFRCEICGQQLGEQAVPVCPGCHRVVCGKHLRVGLGRTDGRCDACRTPSGVPDRPDSGARP